MSVNATTVDLVAAIYGRRAVRAYTEEPVSPADVHRLIQTSTSFTTRRH
jgi:nitroreductase